MHGVSTRKVDALAAACGRGAVSKSEGGWICRELGTELAAFRERPLDDGAYPYLWLDATDKKVREGDRIVSQAVVVAIRVRETGEQQVLGVAAGASETEVFWLACFRVLRVAGLSGTRLVVSGAHQQLRKAVAQYFVEASWQRGKESLPAQHRGRGASDPRPGRAGPGKDHLRPADRRDRPLRGRHVVTLLTPCFPAAITQFQEMEADVLAYLGFPAEHWRSISSPNAIERVNAEIDHRTRVVGIFLNAAALLRLTTAVLQEQHDEWPDARRIFSQQSMALLRPDSTPGLTTRSRRASPPTSRFPCPRELTPSCTTSGA